MNVSCFLVREDSRLSCHLAGKKLEDCLGIGTVLIGYFLFPLVITLVKETKSCTSKIIDTKNVKLIPNRTHIERDSVKIKYL